MKANMQRFLKKLTPKSNDYEPNYEFEDLDNKLYMKFYLM